MRIWWEPLTWTLGQFQWSGMHNDSYPLQTRRERSVTYLELTCAIDILTKGGVGPPGASFRLKTAIVQYGITTALRHCKLSEDIKFIKTNKFPGRLPKVETVAPLGLGSGPALSWP